MNPIESAAPVEPALKLAQAAAQPSPAAESPSVEALTQRFETMMKDPHSAVRSPSSEGPNTLSQMVKGADEMERHARESLAELRADSPNLSTEERVARTIEVSTEISVSTFRMQSATLVASSANKSMQSLLKNQ
jgi:type III secretion system HrpB2-like protein